MPSRIGLSHPSQSGPAPPGPGAAAAPTVWVLTDGKPGHTTQSLGLAEALGWPFSRIDLELRRAADLPNAVLGAGLGGVRRRSRAALTPPWPDLLIACGRRLAPVARWVRRQAGHQTRLVQIGRKGSDPAEYFDLSVVPNYARLLPHPNRIEVVAPPHRAQPDRLAAERLRWEPVVASAHRPRIALLVGGTGRRHQLSPALAAALGRDALALGRRTGGSILATTSRRTPPAAAAALETALRGDASFYRWSRASSGPNPYLGFLALADAFIVTGDSASMLAEASATGKPVLIYPLPRIDRGPSVRWVDGFCEAVETWASSPSAAGRWCRTLRDRGIVRPPPDLERLHGALVAQGAARFFDPLDTLDPPAGHSDDTARVAERVRALLPQFA